MRVAVVTVSDRASRGEYEDRSGPALEAALREAYEAARAAAADGRGHGHGAPSTELELSRAVVPDEREAILATLLSFEDSDWIFTTGGTGPSPRDVTPEATLAFIDRQLPGLAEYLRLESLKETTHAVFSRGVAGMKRNCYVVNAPGSVKAAALCGRIFGPLLAHGRAMAWGEGH
jgi:molybdenum cofactor synthesis domain-containing protein